MSQDISSRNSGRRWQSHSSRTAILYKDSAVTYGELDARAQRWAGRLHQLGVEPGDRVAIMTAEKLPFLAAHLGALQAGRSRFR